MRRSPHHFYESPQITRLGRRWIGRLRRAWSAGGGDGHARLAYPMDRLGPNRNLVNDSLGRLRERDARPAGRGRCQPSETIGNQVLDDRLIVWHDGCVPGDQDLRAQEGRPDVPRHARGFTGVP